MKKLLCLLLCLTCAFGAFTACGGGGGEVPEEEIVIPYTPNPFTGEEKPEGYRENPRPVAVMINNIRQAMPQSGLSLADVTYEIVTEGGITRLMCVFSDYTVLGDTPLGPVRSARNQFVELILPYNPIYMHIGESNRARLLLNNYGYEDREINGNFKSIEDLYFYRDLARWRSGYDWEHVCYTTGTQIGEAIVGLELPEQGEPTTPIFNFVNYNDAPRLLEGGLATSIKWEFSAQPYRSTLTYDETLNQYLKSQFGAPQIDASTGRQLAYTNALVLFTQMELYPGDTLMNVTYDNGFGYYFYGGRYEQVRWIKGSTPTNPLRIVDAAGNEIDVALNTGNTYIAIVSYEYYDKFEASFINESPIPGTETPEGETSEGDVSASTEA